MGQRPNNAAVKVAQIKVGREEYALSMGRRRIDAAIKDVQIKLSKEEYAKGMGQRSNDAAETENESAIFLALHSDRLTLDTDVHHVILIT